MQKIREWLIKLQDEVTSNTKRLDRYDNIFDWILKLVIGTIILALLGLIIVGQSIPKP